MKTYTDFDLTPLNTLRLPARAKVFKVVESIEELADEFKSEMKERCMVLGDGSNVLFTGDFEGTMFKLQLLGVKVIEETEESVVLHIAAGENWHDLVTEAVNSGWGGIENLALIPGTVGAAPVQNIAAYGQSISNVLESVEYFDVMEKGIKVLDKQGCQFRYRNSIFKHELKNRAIIVAVRLKLSKKPQLETGYYSVGGRNDSLQKELEQHYSQPYSIKDIYETVIKIRTEKLLDWRKHPTVGSFFINPTITKTEYLRLHQKDPLLQCYPPEDTAYKQIELLEQHDQEYVKVPVGRLLDYLGWKGKQIGNCMVSENLASILTHNGKATGKEFYEFAETIRQDVYQKLGIDLATEVNIV